TQVLPDLRVTDVTAPAAAAAGTEVKVSWEVENVGITATEATFWTDEVYLATAPTLNVPGARYQLLERVPHQGELPAGEHYEVKDWAYLLPIDAEGQHLIVKTGVREDPFKQNDSSSAPLAVTNAPSDLRVIQIKTPPQNFSGEKARIEWTVQNFGAPVWTGTTSWQDTVYLSPDATFIADRATLLDSFAYAHTPQLVTGGTYTQVQDVVLPKGIDGPWYIHIRTNP